MNTLAHRASEALRLLLERTPGLKVNDIALEPPGFDDGIDIVARITFSKRRHTLVCQVTANGQPRHVRMALLHLRGVARIKRDATPIFIAPYLSPEAQALCQEHSVGFLDLEGNARIAFDGVFIERLVPTRPAIERRELKSIFKPKSAQVLRVLLRDPSRPWRVVELAEAADVSLGHVSNVRTGLIDREWAKVESGGFLLTRPDAVLDAWRDAYEPPAGSRLAFYTTLHGNALERALRDALGAANKDGQAILASFSAAQWLAPYARTGSQFLYADQQAIEALQHALKLSSAAKGENVIITQLRDDGLFRDKVEAAPGIVCTSPVQTYLDLATASERGREAAEHLRSEKLKWLR